MTYISKQLVLKSVILLRCRLLHGCPSDEIERIAAYLLSEKGSIPLLNVIQPC